MIKDKELSWDEILSCDGEVDLIFEKEQLKKILSDLGNHVDEEDFVTDINTTKRIIGQDGGEIKFNQLGGILSGSKGFIKKNIANFSEFIFEKRDR